MNLNDSGAGSLRDAIDQANTAGGTNTIEFTAGLTGTITLTSVSLPTITNDLSIIGPLTAPGITIDGNHSSRAFQVNAGFNVSLQNLTVINGNASRTGGAIFNNGSLTIDNCTFSDNQAVDASLDFPFAQGGAIDNDGSLTITNSTFAGNQAIESAGGSNPPNLAQGGAIFTDTGSTLTVTNSTFSGNEALNNGTGAGRSPTVTSGSPVANGGAISGNAGSTMTITNCTFSGNEVSAATAIGGAIATAAPSIENLKGTILAGQATGGNCSIAGTLNDNGYNLSDDGSCGFSGTSKNNVSNINLDPAGLKDNGGPTDTIALEQNSQAVDFIPVANCTDQSSPTPQPLTTDQRGFQRPDPGNPNFCDAGAFELTTTPFAVSSAKLEIARSVRPNSDQIDLALTFTELGFPMCDAGTDAFNGFFVVFESGRCADLEHQTLEFFLHPWVVHTIGGVTYGTMFASFPPGSSLARMVELAIPPAPACGQWNLALQIAGVDSVPLGDGPFSLVLFNGDGGQQCFDVTDAIVGGQIPTPPPTRRVRRGSRR